MTSCREEAEQEKSLVSASSLPYHLPHHLSVHTLGLCLLCSQGAGWMHRLGQGHEVSGAGKEVA